ncbi:MAG TPA: 2-dehydropantoate 2-reductase [Candidatus Binataceae bacterium]|jgi:2-dehydropantoate 2-reductase|nr:2-dehydropantoate 2-reductase [Candidatus Binataceae bacterium]
MKILVMGAGAVGAYYGARLQQAGEDVVYCARGENLRAMQQRGIEIASIRGDLKLAVNATDEPGRFAPYDLILFCVKVYDTEAAAAAIKGCLAPDGAIMTLQNGVENEARLSELFGAGAVMGGNARIGAELVAPGKIEHKTSGTIEFGELDGRVTARTDAIAEAMRRAGIFGELSTNVRASRWDKLMWNAAFNTVTTLTHRTVGEVLDDPEGYALIRNLMEEVRAAAAADGVELSRERIAQVLAHSNRNLRPVRTSTLQDLQRGKPLEVEALIGVVVRTARHHGIKAPISETIYALMRLVDRSPSQG